MLATIFNYNIAKDNRELQQVVQSATTPVDYNIAKDNRELQLNPWQPIRA